MAQREGHLYVDHRASPGFTDEAMARRMGGRVGSVLIENATLTCAHCRTAVIKNPFRSRERNYCPHCRTLAGDKKYICDVCAFRASLPDYVHMPMEKVVELALKGG